MGFEVLLTWLLLNSFMQLVELQGVSCPSRRIFFPLPLNYNISETSFPSFWASPARSPLALGTYEEPTREEVLNLCSE